MKGHTLIVPVLSLLASGASTYTLDSGIGTFPLPNYCSGTPGRSLSKVRGAGAEHGSSGSPGRAGRRARTLDREPSSMEQCYQSHREMTAPVMYGSVLEGKGMPRQTAGVIHEGTILRNTVYISS